MFLRKLATDSSREEEEGPFDQKNFRKKNLKKKLRRGGATAGHRAGEIPVFFFPTSGELG